ncbi:uncharacterized protein MELLADRAFT_87371 [Melampsora larici-populina 98AG31]|uniref:Uncharacterized protein n=1 Tax=Melampsora larici-populina (strain 98AG31 / pathotype 3-4-7) TaxID=747676 RepID=F4RN22_MELLP|nr:uncharacterized protein MELLADRAFT_87371 [Melampsora larici-populina 98AG31]EGG06222.1 hypothetical protein MELLADRAFT_87371 [Melampsora larici-populina 98AG31]
MEVEINGPTQGTPKVGAGKKAAKADRLNLVDSKAINTGFLEIQTCPIGMSLNEFKDLVAGACEEYEVGLKNLILNSVFSPDLKWKTTVGHFKVVLDGAVQWQNFVEALKKSTRKKGIVSIKNKNMQVRVRVSNKESATKKLIAATNGTGAEDQESEESKNKQELNTLANQILSQHVIGTYAGEPGVMAKIATVHIPPNTPEFQYEIKKNQWIHPNMGVDDRCNTQPGASARPEEDQVQGNEYESDWSTKGESSSIEFEVQRPSTSHTVQFKLFLADCNIAFDDVKTRTILREDGMVLWTNLIPSVKLTEAILTAKGMDRQIANRLMTEAQARYLKCKIRDFPFGSCPHDVTD